MGFHIQSLLLLAPILSIGVANTFANEAAPLKPADCLALIDANAGDPSRVDERCFLITSVRIDESESDRPAPMVSPRLIEGSDPWSTAAMQQGTGGGGLGALGQAGAVIGAADKITLIGQRIWNFIKDNQPTDYVSAATSDAFPEGLRSPSLLLGWSRPQVKQFRVVYTNLVGFDVVDFTYEIAYTYGGRIQGKKGHYLTNVQVRPGNLKVLWGFHFDFSGGAMKALNVGTTQDPVAAIEISARWRVHSVLVTLASSENFYIKGTGSIERITAEGTLP